MELVLNTYGCKLSTENNAFVVANAAGKQRIPCTSVDSIVVAKSAVLTSDALLMAIENDIQVQLADRVGKTVGCVWSHKYGSISTIRKGQLAFSASPDSVTWIKDVIKKKMENQLALLLMLESDATRHNGTVRSTALKIDRLIGKLELLQGDSVRDVAANLRAYEGNASREYFQTLNCFIPERFRFSERSQRPARDVANALLNYGYGMLYGKVENALIRAGIDPYIGILHRDEYGRPVLSYDVIELYRVWVDYVVYSLLAQNIITDEYYSVDASGAVWLEGLGRRVIIQALNDYLSENENIKGIQRSRGHHIFLYAQKMAQTFKHY